MRREARDPITDIQNSFSHIYYSLLIARRNEAVKISVEAEKVKAELKAVQKANAEKDAYIAHLQSQLRAQPYAT